MWKAREREQMQYDKSRPGRNMCIWHGSAETTHVKSKARKNQSGRAFLAPTDRPE